MPHRSRAVSVGSTVLCISGLVFERKQKTRVDKLPTECTV